MIYNHSLSLLFVRLLLGIILFWQGWGKVFQWGLDNVYSNHFASFEVTFLPTWLIKFTAYFTSYGELIGGALLILGLFRKWTYLGIVIILITVAFGHGLKDYIWDLSHVMFRAILLFPLLFFPLVRDSYSIDEYFIEKRKKN